MKEVKVYSKEMHEHLLRVQAKEIFNKLDDLFIHNQDNKIVAIGTEEVFLYNYSFIKKKFLKVER